ncbi:hypothetical protein [Streptococcus respiraculi]|nr:hypothetical protein [Streptococcus respiraculi]
MPKQLVPKRRFPEFTDAWERKSPVEIFCDFLDTRKKSSEVGGVLCQNN